MTQVPNYVFKRGQVETALAYAIQYRPPADEGLLLDIKKLLDRDRAIRVDKRAKAAELKFWAFAEEKTVGRGTDVRFTSYDVCALYLGVRLWRVGFSQQRVVSRLRALRPTLKEFHREILAKHPEDLLDHEIEFDIETEVSNATLVTKLENMVALVLPTGRYDGLTYKTETDQERHFSANVCRGTEISLRLQTELAFGGAPIVIELVNRFHQLNYWLTRIPETRRGRQ